MPAPSHDAAHHLLAQRPPMFIRSFAVSFFLHTLGYPSSLDVRTFLAHVCVSIRTSDAASLLMDPVVLPLHFRSRTPLMVDCAAAAAAVLIPLANLLIVCYVGVPVVSFQDVPNCCIGFAKLLCNHSN